jgi:flagellar hook-associated protein 3 FlgL
VGDEGLTATLQSYLDAAEKEASYADENMQKTYDQYITNFNHYMEKVNIANTNVGSTEVRLSMTQTRVENQTTTTTELKSQNEDRDLSDVIIDYYAAYYAYQASLTAAGKLNQTTLLDYI